MIEKKVQINHKLLSISDLKFEKSLEVQQIGRFLNLFLDEKPFYEIKTSGSTGVPKTIKLSKMAMKASAHATLKYLNIKKGDTTLLCLSPDYIAGTMMLVRWLVGDLHLITSKVEANPLDKIPGNIDFAAMVPYQAEAGLKHLHRVKKLILGGAPVSHDLEERLLQVSVEVFHTYGMTETISHVAMRKIGAEHFEALPDVTFSVDERSCLKIEAPLIEVNNLQTNDVVDLIDTSHFIWKGRADFVINSGGVKLHPEEIESKIILEDRKIMVAGLPDDKLGEKLVLFVEGNSFSFDENLVFSHLSKYEKPKAVYFLPEFGRTSNGKINRYQTLALYERDNSQ